MSTIRDVAQRAGVSTMTVSRVVNKSGYVSADARTRVEAAIAELDYVPNTLARSLRFKQTKMLALVLSDITNPFFTTVARGVEDTASEAGFHVVFCNTDESEIAQGEQLNALIRRQIDGILLVPAPGKSDWVEFVRQHRVPLVVLDRRVPGCQLDTVRGDSEQGAHDLTQHLLGLGHRRIAMLSGPVDVSTAGDRVAGYRRALAQPRSGERPEWVSYGPFTQASGYQMAQQALLAWPRPTAIVAANNFIAFGAYQAVRAAGLRVPEDVALVCFDDLPVGLVMEPFLTVAAQPAYEMGRRATDLLLRRLSGDRSAGVEEIVLPTELIVRQSSGRPLDHALR